MTILQEEIIGPKPKQMFQLQKGKAEDQIHRNNIVVL